MASADTAVRPADAAPPIDQTSRGYYPELFLVSFAGLLLEIGYTRVISFKLFYYYTYFVIGLALLGIGAGAVLVTVSARVRAARTDTIMRWSLLLGAASVAIGYVIIAVTSLDTFAIWQYGSLASFHNLALLLLICLALFASFVPIGVVTATLFSRTPDRIHRLYLADLTGAGVAGGIVVALLSSIGAPGTVMIAGLAMAVASLRTAASKRFLPLAGLLVIGLGALTLSPGVLPDQHLETAKAALFPPVTIYSSWSPIFRVDAAVIPKINVIFLYHDGLLGSAIYHWNGQQASLANFDFQHDLRSLPFAVSDSTPRNELIIGAAGGKEVLTSLYYHVGHVDAVELNPVTWSLVTSHFANYDGHLAQKPGVNYVKGDGRSYLARSHKRYNLIWYPAPDSYSASNASTEAAFVLSESYLYTRNAIVSSLNHLAPNGILAAQFGEVDYAARPNRTTRYVATARHALDQLGIRDPGAHIMVAISKSSSVIGGATESTILVKKTAFTAAEIKRFEGDLQVVPGSALQYAPTAPPQQNSVTTVATSNSSDLAHFYASYPYNVKPITDNDPYFWHFARFSDVIQNFSQPLPTNDLEVIQGERVLILLLGVSILLAIVFLLLPFLAIRQRWRGFRRKGMSGLYFAALGFGFFFFEITLIQRLILFLGYPTYSITVALASLLIFVGLGAYLSGRIARPSGRVILVLTGAITALTAFYLFGLPHLTSALLGWSLAARVVVAFVVLAPLGVCLGMFMPLGIRTVAELGGYPQDYVAWGWAVNGFASVVGATLTTVLSMTLGFNLVLGFALASYLLALLALHRLATPRDAVPA
jgi:spermidine synthase